MIIVYEPGNYPAWVFVEFTAGDTDLKYELPPLMRRLCVYVNNSRYIIDKQQFYTWVETRREFISYLTVAPIWVGDTEHIWLAWINGEPIAITPPTLKKPESVKPIKPPKNIPALMERNFWPIIRALGGVTDKVTKKLICR